MGKIVPNNLYHGDCMVLMDDIETASIDLILCDLPYGTTKNHWDQILPFNDYIEVKVRGRNRIYYHDDFMLYCYNNGTSKKEADDIWNSSKRKGLWTHYERIIKDNGAIVLFAQAPFDKQLAMSNEKLFRYEWIWEKNLATGFLNAEKMPLKTHENILVFYKKLPTYNPIKTKGVMKVSTVAHKLKCKDSSNYGKQSHNKDYRSDKRYPKSVLKYKTDKHLYSYHPNQKPLELVKYLIKTYSNENDVVLDNCMGGGTTPVGCIHTNRRYIAIEGDKEIFDDAHSRVQQALGDVGLFAANNNIRINDLLKG